MNDLLLFCFMGLTVLVVLVALIRSAGRYKSYTASPNVTEKPTRATTNPFRSGRAQEIWNRLNPKVYLDDDKTEPMPPKELNEQSK